MISRDDTILNRVTSDITLDNEELRKQVHSNYAEAERLLEDEDAMERFLQRLERKLKLVPLVGEKMSSVPMFISLVRAYTKKEYRDIPIGSIIAIVSALIYFLSPIDLVPDGVPIIGYIDDALVLAFVWNMVEDDIKEYIKWQEKNGKRIDFDD